MKRSLVLLWLLSLVCTLAGIPYSFELQSEVIAQVPFPLWIFVLIALAQTAALLAVAVYFGAKLAKNIGLRIFALIERTPGCAGCRGIMKLGITAGILTAFAIYALDHFLVRFTPQLSVDTVHATWWKTLLASFYGGVVEEVLLRLFFLSLIAWFIAKLFRVHQPVENRVVMWSAIVISSVAFGLGHLPVTAALTAITPLIVIRAILLNGVGGLVFGWLYWRRGLEFSITAHFITDIVLLSILPSLLK